MASRAIGSIMTPFVLVHTWLTKKTQWAVFSNVKVKYK
jgi:hypothetical protein